MGLNGVVRLEAAGCLALSGEILQTGVGNSQSSRGHEGLGQTQGA